MIFEAFETNLRTLASRMLETLGNRIKEVATKTEQADNPPLRYATVMTHLCIVFVLFVSLQR